MIPLFLDKESLRNFYGDVPDVIRTILHDYLANLPGIITSLQEGFAAGSDALRSAAHFHAAAFCYVGFPQLHAECKALEERCRQTPAVQDLRPEFERLLSRIEESGRLTRTELSPVETMAA